MATIPNKKMFKSSDDDDLGSEPLEEGLDSGSEEDVFLAPDEGSGDEEKGGESY